MLEQFGGAIRRTYMRPLSSKNKTVTTIIFYFFESSEVLFFKDLNSEIIFLWGFLLQRFEINYCAQMVKFQDIVVVSCTISSFPSLGSFPERLFQCSSTSCNLCNVISRFEKYLTFNKWKCTNVILSYLTCFLHIIRPVQNISLRKCFLCRYKSA